MLKTSWKHIVIIQQKWYPHITSQKHSASSYGSLVDRGANGGLAEAEVHVPERTGSKVSNSILAWLTANPPGLWPQNTSTRLG